VGCNKGGVADGLWVGRCWDLDRLGVLSVCVEGCTLALLINCDAALTILDHSNPI
jgi:hypothetical protein